MKRKDIKSLYYITHKNNVKSILQYGILSHQDIQQKDIQKAVIYNESVINIRANKKLPNGENLSHYANLYFQPRNPMLYSVLHTQGEGTFSKGTKDIVLLEIKKSILDIARDKFVATANAATTQALFFSDIDKGLQKTNKIIIDDEAWWNDLSGGKTKIMAEFLVKESIPPKYIMSVYTAHEEVLEELKKLDLVNSLVGKINIVLDRVKFFLPNKTIQLNNKIKLVQGDMFFSAAQTLTISVNIMGVMGKGLASRTRYQFPDVFVEYQDLCRSKKLKMGKPCLIKREKSLDEVLAYDATTLQNKNQFKWFLLFATKDHWKNDSDFEGIEKGLQWLVANYEKQGITSIALPALGCGLGRLSWAKIGKLICYYLNQMNIKSMIYLPMNQDIPDNQLTPPFLLSTL